MTTAPARPVGYPGDLLDPSPGRPAAGDLPVTAEGLVLSAGELLGIAEGLARSAPLWPGMARPVGRVWDLMAASPRFEAWVIAWPTGGSIELHDHGSSAGAVVVASGELRETTVVEDGTGVGACLTRVLMAGESVSFGANYVHGFVNVATSPALSVHVYSPRLTSMTYFSFAEGRLEPGRVQRYDSGLSVPSS